MKKSVMVRFDEELLSMLDALSTVAGISRSKMLEELITREARMRKTELTRWLEAKNRAVMQAIDSLNH